MADRQATDYVKQLGLAVLLVLLLATVGSGQELPAEKAEAAEISITGEAVERSAAVDSWMQTFLRDNRVPGASVAIAVDGELMFSRGYGYADREAKTPVEPTALFRIASVSKPITAVAILKLVDEGNLRLTDNIVDTLQLRPAELTQRDYDPWWNDITLAHLLTHTAGWDRNRSGDPMFENEQIMSWLGLPMPLTHDAIIAYQLRRGIDYAPGERFAYSNFGYCLLGRMIEKASGQSYEAYVREQLFQPLGIESARIGGSLASEQLAGEVKYYTSDDYESDAVIAASLGSRVPGQYGGWDQPLLDSHGGWVMSSADLVKFGLALDVVDNGAKTRGNLLTVAAAKSMFTPQASYQHTPYEQTFHPTQSDRSAPMPAYGYGWTVGRLEGRPFVVHNGALPCTGAILARIDERIWFAALLNLGKSGEGKWLAIDLEQHLSKQILQCLHSP